MNETTVKLLEQLAAKLGTTTEYLWGILLNQSYISAITDLLIMLATLIFGFIFYKTHRRLAKKDNNIRNGHNLYYKYNEAAVVPMALAGVAFGCLSIYCACSIGNIIYGFFNPEYWALKEILDALK